ncbi:MAG: Alcohol dehydrogenase, zinc-binding, partial [uncultured Rubrobacteraceae bacterium]
AGSDVLRAGRRAYGGRSGPKAGPGRGSRAHRRGSHLRHRRQDVQKGAPDPYQGDPLSLRARVRRDDRGGRRGGRGLAARHEGGRGQLRAVQPLLLLQGRRSVHVRRPRLPQRSFCRVYRGAPPDRGSEPLRDPRGDGVQPGGAPGAPGLRRARGGPDTHIRRGHGSGHRGRPDRPDVRPPGHGTRGPGDLRGQERQPARGCQAAGGRGDGAGRRGGGHDRGRAGVVPRRAGGGQGDRSRWPARPVGAGPADGPQGGRRDPLRRGALGYFLRGGHGAAALLADHHPGHLSSHAVHGAGGLRPSEKRAGRGRAPHIRGSIARRRRRSPRTARAPGGHKVRDSPSRRGTVL